MAQAVNAKVSGLNVNQSPKKGQVAQSCLNVEMFFTRLIWDKTSDKHYNGCLVEIARLFERVGLVYATEHTYVSAISALALARMHSEGCSQINPKDGYMILNELKAMVRADTK